MGGGQANKGQATQSFGGAGTQVSQANQISQNQQDQSKALGAQAQDFGSTAKNFNSQQQGLYNTLFGTPTGGSGAPSGSATPGALTKMLDPSSLNVTSPTGTYALQYANTAGGIDTATQQAQAAAARNAANRGFGAGSPSGFAQDQALKTDLAGAAAKGQAYQGAATSQYQDALNNFWKSVNAAQTQGGQSQQGASTATGAQTATQGQGVTANADASNTNQGGAQTYAQLYGTSGAYHPSQAGQIIGGALGAAGQIGSAGITKFG